MANPNWTKGVSGNPAGRTPGGKSFIDRARYLMEEHTLESIQEYVADENKFKKLPIYDAMVMRRIIEAIGTDGKGSMDSLLDRVMGRPKQYIEQDISQVIEYNATERRIAAEKEAQEMMEKLADVTGSIAT